MAGGVNFAFKYNDTAFRLNQVDTGIVTRVAVWLDGYLNGQEGIFRISKLSKDFFEFGGKVAEATQFAWVTTWTSLIVKVSDFGIKGTTLPHFYTTLKPLKDDYFAPHDGTGVDYAKTIKKLADVVAGFMFSAMLVGSSSVASVLGTPANVAVIVGDLADLYTETTELGLLQRMLMPGIVIPPLPASVGGTDALRAAGAQKAARETHTLQMLKLAKVVVSVFAGVVFACECILPMLAVTTAMMLTAAQFKMIYLSCALLSSVLAVGANYYKTTMVWQITNVRAVAPVHAHAQ